jgi:hypothetical protein
MHCQQLVIATVAVLAWAVSAAPGPLPEEMVHGGFMEHEGQMYRYHQLARDVFTTVPVDEFDEKRKPTLLDFSAFRLTKDNRLQAICAPTRSGTCLLS